MKQKKFFIGYYLVLVLALIIFWLVTLFPINLRDHGFFMVLIIFSALAVLPWVVKVHVDKIKSNVRFEPLFERQPKRPIPIKGRGKLLYIPMCLVVLMFILGATGWLPFRSKSYASLIHKTEGDFGKDIAELDFYDIPTIDRETAVNLGNKRMGEMTELVSQFDVALDYTQINYKNEPTRVTPLAYDGFFKWMGNRNEGLPNLVTVNLVTGDVDLVPIEGGMKFSESEPFFRNIQRHVRLHYPTAILGDAKFEIDENATPHWIYPVLKPQVGWFSGLDVVEVIIVNAVDGSSEKMPVDQVPTWVDRVYPSELMMEQLDHNGKYQDGFWNSMFGQRGVLQTTDGYNYLALNDDVYLYTGITSVAGDSSNLGFVLVNQRTKDTKFYKVSSADESSSMRSAQGAVQEKGYVATFPILLNVNGRPTYCMALKDNAQLVKMYAMVDAQNYQTVATGISILEAMQNYQTLLQAQSLGRAQEEAAKTAVEPVKLEGEINGISSVVVEGNTHYYLRLEGEDQTFAAPVSLTPDLAFLKVGDQVELSYQESEDPEAIRVLTELKMK